ncbi:YegP family protein [Lewinella sp. LCG006]|uniref:YegP family protein n=1 Tax=Lewinella sp. LCG006 TaxID=3231911 RepID=UPI003460553B
MQISKFFLFKSPRDDQYYWHLKAKNNEIILQSEGYVSKQGAEKGIQSVRENSPFDERYERLDSKDGQYYFVLKARNGEIIGISETYTTKASRDAGIETVKREAPCAPIEDLTLTEEERKKRAKAIGDAQKSGGLVIVPSAKHCKEPIPVKPKGGVYGQAVDLKVKHKFFPHRQLAAFQRLAEKGLVTELEMSKGSRNRYVWTFRLGAFSFGYADQEVKVDYQNYILKVVYSEKTEPRVFVTTPNLPKNTKHIYKEGHLCLYKPGNWEWQNSMQFDVDLFPNICSWIYQYENWRDTGEWLGEEAPHDPPAGLLNHILNHRNHG